MTVGQGAAEGLPEVMGASSWLVATVAQVRTQKRALAGVGRWASVS